MSIISAETVGAPQPPEPLTSPKSIAKKIWEIMNTKGFQCIKNTTLFQARSAGTDGEKTQPPTSAMNTLTVHEITSVEEKSREGTEVGQCITINSTTPNESNQELTFFIRKGGLILSQERHTRQIIILPTGNAEDGHTRRFEIPENSPLMPKEQLAEVLRQALKILETYEKCQTSKGETTPDARIVAPAAEAIHAAAIATITGAAAAAIAAAPAPAGESPTTRAVAALDALN